MPLRSKRKTLTKKNDKGKESKRDTSFKKVSKQSCRKNQTLLVSRSGLDDISVTVRLAPAEKEANFGSVASVDEIEKWNDRSIASVEGEKFDDGYKQLIAMTMSYYLISKTV